jgi:hypothetical protein
MKIQTSFKTFGIYAVGLGGVVLCLYGLAEITGWAFNLESLNFTVRSKSGYSAALFLLGGGSAAIYWCVFELRLQRDSGRNGPPGATEPEPRNDAE